MSITKLLFCFLLPFISSSQCDQHLYFSSDGELENFIGINPNCKTVSNITFAGPDITNLALISFFDTIQNLTISNIPTVKELEFLEKTEVLSSISLWSLDNLESLSKFYDSQPNHFNIISCPKIKSINLTRSHYNSISFQTPDLEVLVSENIFIESFNLSHNVILHTEEQIKVNQLWLQNATEYSSFTTLVADFNLDTLTTLQIAGYEHFSSEGFPDTMVCKSFSMGSIKDLNCSGFENKTAFFNNMTLSTIDNLKDLSSFDHMITKDYLTIGSLDSLTSLDGIPISDYIIGLFISSNQMLSDINDVEKANEIRRIYITDNPLLESCSINPICDLLESNYLVNNVKISGNRTTCENIPAVETACQERIPVECNASFLGTTKYGSNQVNISFEFTIPESEEESCYEVEKTITIHLDGQERKEIYNGLISSSNSDIQKLDFQISNMDLLNEDFDCLDIAVQSICDEHDCYFYICQILNRKDNPNLSDLSIYPNPASENITISTKVDFETNIIDINGQVVKKVKLITGPNPVILSGLQSGIYFIRDNENQYRKIVVY